MLFKGVTYENGLSSEFRFMSYEVFRKMVEANILLYRLWKPKGNRRTICYLVTQGVN